MILFVVAIRGNADAHSGDRFPRSVVDHASEAADIELILFMIVGVAALARLADFLGKGCGIGEGIPGEARQLQRRNDLSCPFLRKRREIGIAASAGKLG